MEVPPSSAHDTDDLSSGRAPDSAERELRWQLGTVIGSTSAILVLFALSFLAMSSPETTPLLVVPLAVYSVAKIVACACKLRGCEAADRTPLIKDIVEAAIMITYYVRMSHVII